MNASNLLALPLAQRSNWNALGTRFSGDHLTLRTEDVIGFTLLAACLIGGYFLLKLLADLQQRRPMEQGPKRLFAELARVHGMSFGERKTCREAATEIGTDSPAEVFVRPDARRAVAQRDGELAARLFGPLPD